MVASGGLGILRHVHMVMACSGCLGILRHVLMVMGVNIVSGVDVKDSFVISACCVSSQGVIVWNTDSGTASNA